MDDSLKPAFQKNLRAQAETLVVRVMVPDEKGENFYAMSFEKSRIDYVMAMKGDTPALMSALVLTNGLKIPVLMSHNKLEQKVYFTDLREQSVLDLFDVTGTIAMAAQVPAIGYNIASPEKDPVGFVDTPLTICVFVRQPQEQNLVMFTFKDTDVRWSGVANEDGRNGSLTRVPLLKLESPFGGRDIIFDLARPAFMELYNQAKMEGKTELDLRELTRRRDPDKTLEKRGFIGGRPPKF